MTFYPDVIAFVLLGCLVLCIGINKYTQNDPDSKWFILTGIVAVLIGMWTGLN